VKIYAELTGDSEKYRIKSLYDNILKSQMEAGEALYELAVTATQNQEVNEIYTAGVKRDQSKIVFNECDLMTRGTLLRSKFRFKRDQIEHLKTGSFMKALSKEDGKSGDGTNPAMLIIDRQYLSM
jgi:phage terminase large subunit-like protein